MGERFSSHSSKEEFPHFDALSPEDRAALGYHGNWIDKMPAGDKSVAIPEAQLKPNENGSVNHEVGTQYYHDYKGDMIKMTPAERRRRQEQSAEIIRQFEAEQTELNALKREWLEAHNEAQNNVRLGETHTIPSGETWFNLGLKTRESSPFLKDNENKISANTIGAMIAIHNKLAPDPNSLKAGDTIKIPTEAEFQELFTQHTIPYELAS